MVYIPRAHYDTINKYPETAVQTAPWKSFPQNSAWPVVLCKVRAIRYRFPIEHLYRNDGQRYARSIIKGRQEAESNFFDMFSYIFHLGRSVIDRSIVAVVALHVIGIPKIRADGSFPWPVPEFIMQRSTRRSHQEFEVRLIPFVGQ